ncbi:hypothetical protein DF186_11070 [Enterococcus hirae]|nr:hypothetical protein CHB54_00010 [Enterococcus hirae]PWG75782.1 hypothetical protein DF186_11070 [Enterococcus hirae]
MGAYANGNLVQFVVDAVVFDYGISTLTHEMTHDFDGGIYFSGYDRRDGSYEEMRGVYYNLHIKRILLFIV